MGTNPVRCARFIVRKNWIIAGTDDMKLRVYNYNTMEKVKEWDAHTDYIRFIEVHPNRPYVLRYIFLKLTSICASTGTNDTAFSASSASTSLIFFLLPSSVHFSSSDDMSIKLWDWDRDFECIQVQYSLTCFHVVSYLF